MRRALTGALALGALVLTGGSMGAASFSDAAGDDNAAPDVTSVRLHETAGLLDVQVAVANFQTLPQSSWFNLWFDVDNDVDTGDAVGDDALVFFPASGVVELYLWDGEAFAQAPATGINGRFDAGRLSLIVPTSALGSVSSPGILVVGARSQVVATETLVASDFTPETGRARWIADQPLDVADPAGDFDAAPDITGVDVSDATDGWIRFSISTPNRATLPGESIVAVSIDADGSRATGDDGAELTITDVGDEVFLERWNAGGRRWDDDTPPTRVRARSGTNVVTIEIHRSELRDTPRFGFRLVSADLNVSTGALLAVDFAPDSGTYWRYQLANAPSVRLVAGRTVGVPTRPRAGEPFSIRTPVRRSDARRGLTSGRATCDVRAGATRVPARGSVRRGYGICTLVVPRNARTIAGSMTIRSGGRAVTARFSFRVR